MVLPLHLELDTGMGRGGCCADEAGMMIERIAANPRLQLHGIMTHFADPAGDRKIARSQRSQVLELVEKHREHIPSTCRLHAAATGGLDEAALRLDMVRIGLAWTGLVEGLFEVGVDPGPLAALRPVLSLWSHVVSVRHVEAGFKVGYGSRWQAKRRSTIGLVPVGYAHGLPASRPGQHHRVVVHTDQGPRDVPVIGAVNMDQVSVDLTDIGAIEVGVAVEVMSNDRTSPAFLARVASRAGVSPYALLTGLDPRLPRVMVAGHDAHVVTQSPVAHASRLSLGQP
jgi:alanine racemase